MHHEAIAETPAPVAYRHDAVILRARARFATMMGRLAMDSCCLTSATCAVLASADLGYPCLFQAGSMQWRCRSESEPDDGVSATHFAYMWSPEEAHNRQLLAGLKNALRRAELSGRGLDPGSYPLPEVHCWAVWPVNTTCVDLTTGTLPDECRRRTGGLWTAPIPPKYFIGVPDGETARYTADEMATCLMFHTARLLLRHASTDLEAYFVNHVRASCRPQPAGHPH